MRQMEYTEIFPMADKPKVLLVDDEKFLLEIYSIKFLKSGFDVFACTSVDEALTALQNGYSPDAIILDISMPDKNGYEFLEALRTIPLKQTCVKVALTNEGQEAEIKRTAELGVNAHLIKAQYTQGEVVEKVKMLINHE